MGNLAQLNNTYQRLLIAHYEHIQYTLIEYSALSVEVLRAMKRGTGLELRNKSNQPFSVRRKTVFERRNERILESSVSYEVENGFGDIILSGSAENVYKGLCRLTDSDVPF